MAWPCSHQLPKDAASAVLDQYLRGHYNSLRHRSEKVVVKRREAYVAEPTYENVTALANAHMIVEAVTLLFKQCPHCRQVNLERTQYIVGEVEKGALITIAVEFQ